MYRLFGLSIVNSWIRAHIQREERLSRHKAVVDIPLSAVVLVAAITTGGIAAIAALLRCAVIGLCAVGGF